MSQLEKIVHTTILSVFTIVAILSLQNAEKFEKSDNPEALFINKITPRFYTNWGYGLSILYYACIVLSHILSRPATQRFSEKLRTISDYLFTIIVVPIGVEISVTFWAIYAIDRELIFPSWLDELVPNWMNQSLHTFNSILPVLDMLLTRHRFPSWRLSTGVLTVFLLAYLVCMIDTRLRYGKYMYVILKYFTTLQVGYYCLLNVVLAFIFHAAIRYICRWRWGSSIFELTSEEKKQL